MGVDIAQIIANRRIPPENPNLETHEEIEEDLGDEFAGIVEDEESED